MGLKDFILENMEEILAEWEAFAATILPAAAQMTRLALRNDAQDILEAVAHDLSTAQTREEQAEKSKGRASILPGAPETAAQAHAVLRARSGFDINQLVAEYRALRASVIRLWTDASPLGPSKENDLIRFNEAIDQAVAESVGYFHTEVERSRNLFLGMLGHDMRTPLNSIVMTASYLAAIHAGDEVSQAAQRMIRSGESIQALLDDLVDFNRTQLGVGIKLLPSDIDLAAHLRDEIEQLRAAYPSRQIDSAIEGETRGRWDGLRVRQILRNLVSNAIEHGSADAPIRVACAGNENEARIQVTNIGVLDPSVVGGVFNPLKRGYEQTGNEVSNAHLGLGLFIVQVIAQTHGGEVTVESEGGETTFTARLPHAG